MPLPIGNGQYGGSNNRPHGCWADNTPTTTPMGIVWGRSECLKNAATAVGLCLEHHRAIVDPDYLTHADAVQAWIDCGPAVSGSAVPAAA